MPNQDGAGVVDAVGEARVASRSATAAPGGTSRHTRRSTGTAQEYTVVPAQRAAKLPDGIGFDVGESLGVPAMTAHRGVMGP